MLRRFALVFYLLSSLNNYAFQSKDSIIEKSIIKLKNNDINVSITKYKNDTIKNLFSYQLLYKNNGIISDTLILKKELKKLKGRVGIIANYIYGDFLVSRKTPNDSLAFYHYKLALRFAKEKKDTLLINECLLRICDRLFTNGKNLNLFNDYVKEYKIFGKDNVDRFWIHYFQIAHKLLSHLEISKEKNTLNEEVLRFSKGFEFAEGSIYFIGVMHQLKGIYFDVFTTNNFKAENEFKNAITNFEKIPYYYAQKRIYSNKVNVSIALFNQEKVQKSIETFKEALSIKEHNYTDKERMYIFKWLNKAYKKINKIDSAYVYSEKASELKEKIDKYRHSVAIRDIEEKSNIGEKEKEIFLLSELNKTLSKKILSLTPFILIFALAALIFFYFYKRYKSRSKVLEEEQSETLQKLDELKKIVIKNHIILKDKTKVYIADLMYIKSDDHYLNIFLSDDKNHFVRGKLNAITEELPPNFIRCHRSYIVNRNFIKQINSDTIILIDKTQIPLSRSYKDKF